MNRLASDYTTANEQAELIHNSWKCLDVTEKELLEKAALKSDDPDLLQSVVEEIQNDGLLHKLVEDCILHNSPPKVSDDLYSKILAVTINYMRRS